MDLIFEKTEQGCTCWNDVCDCTDADELICEFVSLIDDDDNTLSNMHIRYDGICDAFIWDFVSRIRCKGYGSELMRRVEKYLTESGCEQIGLFVLHENIDAIRLYERLGWYRKEYQSEEFLLYVKDLNIGA